MRPCPNSNLIRKIDAAGRPTQRTATAIDRRAKNVVSTKCRIGNTRERRLEISRNRQVSRRRRDDSILQNLSSFQNYIARSLDGDYPFIGTTESASKVPTAKLLKNLLDDLRDGFVLKNATVRCLAQKPEPGHHLGPIESELRIVAGVDKLADKTVEITLATITQVHGHRDVCSIIDSSLIGGFSETSSS